jgi:hypothetical protein
VGFFPPNPGTIDFDTAENWSTANVTPSDKLDLQTVATHEIGHALGLDHSSVAFTAVMRWARNEGEQARALHVDDKIAISTLYDSFTQAPGCAFDIALGMFDGDGTPWIISCEPSTFDFLIKKWNGSNWVQESARGGAFRIAVDVGQVPWVVVSNGSIFRRSSPDPSVGQWDVVPGCAKDIGFGAGSTWIISCSPASFDFLIKKRADDGSWIQEAAFGGATRISVGPDDVPWVVQSNGNVFRRSSSDPFTGSWVWMESSTAFDVAVGQAGYGWTAVQTSSGPGLFVRNDQSATVRTPEKHEWVSSKGAPAGVTDVSVGYPGDRPWVTTGGGRIFRSTK